MLALRSGATIALAITFLGICIAGVNGKPPSRIVDGTHVKPGELKYMVAVMKDGRHICGGAIISKRHILTAGHCVENPRNMSVVSDIVDLNDSERTVHEVSDIILHPDYVPYTKNTNVERDIAVMVLEDELILGGKLSKVDIPWFQMESGFSATIAGWGYTSPDNAVSSRLMRIRITLLNEQNCMKKNGWFTADRLCGYRIKGTICGGDSGSPLVSGSYVIGIASASTCSIGDAHVYTNVYYYRDWISEVMQQT